jgi:hypothetical protein
MLKSWGISRMMAVQEKVILICRKSEILRRARLVKLDNLFSSLAEK